VDRPAGRGLEPGLHGSHAATVQGRTRRRGATGAPLPCCLRWATSASGRRCTTTTARST
jgi:hypothetical protein